MSIPINFTRRRSILFSSLPRNVELAASKLPGYYPEVCDIGSCMNFNGFPGNAIVKITGFIHEQS